ncbi:hypothetical protein ACLOJK_035799 [Asimina triloba]
MSDSPNFPLMIFSLSFLPLLLCPGIEAKVPAIIVFGDSSVDAGNNNGIKTFLKSNFEPYGRDFEGGQPTGRFCNGKIATDFISEAFGIKPTIPAYLDPAYSIKDFVDGVCFASAGTGFDLATSRVLNVIPLFKELDYFKEYQSRLRTCVGEQKAAYIISEALYIISIGTNDFLENYYLLPRRKSQYSEDQYQDFLAGIARNFVKAIYDLGGRKISLGGLPPMGCLPLERTANIAGGHGCKEEYNVVAQNFNGKMKALVGQMRQQFQGLQLVFPAVYDKFLEIVEKPSEYGTYENFVSFACMHVIIRFGVGHLEVGHLMDGLDLSRGEQIGDEMNAYV